MTPSLRSQLLTIIQAQKPVRILVVGDLMLDKYTWGKVERISPEAPIPVVKVLKEEYRMGGAGSVAANLAALGSGVECLGWLGQDAAGTKLKLMMADLKIGYGGCLERMVPTILKDRVLTKQQQLLRVDFESSDGLTSGETQQLLQQGLNLLPHMDAVVISDYAKGVVSEELSQGLIQAARKQGIPVICDPGKGVPVSRYRGASTIKPNRSETEMATGISIKDQASLLQAAQRLKEESQVEFVSLSLDKEGILFYKDEQHHQLLETDALEVYDVTGAGDMVVSVTACLLAQGFSPIEALQMANVAAEIEITHMGVVALPWAEIRDFLTQDGLGKKLVDLNQLVKDCAGLESPLNFTNGFFDNLSAGHLRFLLEAGRIPGRLVVAINSDASILRAKGEQPLLNQDERARLLASLENVWKVVVFDEADASHLISRIKPSRVIKGARFQGQAIPESAAIAAAGSHIEYLPHYSF